MPPESDIKLDFKSLDSLSWNTEGVFLKVKTKTNMISLKIAVYSILTAEKMINKKENLNVNK